MGQFVFEIGSEEIPARFVRPALAAMREIFLKEMSATGIEFGEVATYGTPRRLGLTVDDLAAMQPDREEVAIGPKVEIAFDADGNPTKVANGFARGQGVDVADLETVDGPKGKCIQARKQVKGQKTRDVLAGIMSRLIGSLPFQKSMRWADKDTPFVRPVHWILSVFDNEVVPVEFAGINSGENSYGHRFMSPDPIRFTTLDEFMTALREAWVMPSFEERRALIEKEANRLADECGGSLMAAGQLLDEVANLVEYPFVELGSFDDEFLEVPKEIIVDAMATHQRYFAVAGKGGDLLPRFIVVANTRVEDPKVMVYGNERVLRARLSDARFFYAEDRKKPLDAFADTLGSVTFEERLGTIAEKIERISEHIRYMTSFIAPDQLETALRAARLCKADLQTSVVYEFASLQGVMGRIYAELQGEPAAISAAIEQHYWPRFAEDELPNEDIAAMVALSDKMDTIVGCFGVGLKPTGTADPYALRRQALGILRILVDRGYRLSIKDWVDFSISTLSGKLTRDAVETQADVMAFFEARYRNWRNQEFQQDTVDAVVSANFAVLAVMEKKIAALTQFRSQGSFESLAVTIKRVMNILKEKPSGVVSPDLFESEAERTLFDQAQRTKYTIGVLVKQDDYLGALQAMMELKAPVDAFFDEVLVMAEQAEVRENRLSLLWELAEMFRQIADFRKIQTAE